MTFFKLKKKCPIRDAETCPYGQEEYVKGCRYKKRSCCHEEKARKSKKTNKNGSLWKWGLLGFGLLMVLFIAEGTIINHIKISQLIYSRRIIDLGIGIGSALIAGAIVAFVIDIPRRLSEYKDSIIDALSSDEYLSTLDEARLTKQRIRITHLLHKKEVPHMPKGLIKLDEEICKYLKKPFYYSYEQKIECSYTTELLDGTQTPGRKYIKKEFSVKYLLYNPHAPKKPTTVDLGMSSSIELEESDDPNTFFKLDKFSVKIDKTQDPYDVFRLFESNRIKLGMLKQPVSKEGYNRKFFLCHSDSHKMAFCEDSIRSSSELSDPNWRPSIEECSNQKDNILFEFGDKMEVELKWRVLVPASDLLFTKRLRYPVKYFTLDYFFNDDQIKLKGQLMGTLINDTKVVTTISDNEHHIGIRTYDWLLPKNGAVIAMLPDGSHSN